MIVMSALIGIVILIALSKAAGMCIIICRQRVHLYKQIVIYLYTYVAGQCVH